MTTISEIDEALDEARITWQRANELADEAYFELDRLLDERCHAPHDRADPHSL